MTEEPGVLYPSSNKAFADRLQAMAVVRGWRCDISSVNQRYRSAIPDGQFI